MGKASTARHEQATGMNGQNGQAPASRPHIEIDDNAGTMRINDARLMNRGRNAFCRRLAEAVTQRPGVTKTIIDLASASCRVEFVPGSANRQTMADVVADAVREASASSRAGDGTPWWQPSTDWVALTAYPRAGGISLWETLEASPGRIRVRHHKLVGDFRRLSLVAEALSRLDTVERCQAIPWSHRLTIDFHPQNGVADWFLDQAEQSYEDLLRSEAQDARPAFPLTELPHHESMIQVASGPARWLYLALGGGALVMTVVGLIVPGIPTVPFLLLSSYAFARSSPRMNHWLRETRFFGPILVEWEQHGGLSGPSKQKLIGLTVVIILVAVILAPLSPLGLVVILLMASASIYGLSRLPGAPDEHEPWINDERPAAARLALPAP